MRNARKSVAQLIGAQVLEVVFTSGGSEANNEVLMGVFSAINSGKNKKFQQQERNELVVSSVEHPSVMKASAHLAQIGVVVKKIPVNRDGSIDLEVFAQMLSSKTALVSMMFANNETGHMFPIQKMVKIAHEHGAYFHCDAVQALGKCPVDVKKWDVDFASFSAHKFYALKGTGVLYQKKGVIFEPLIHGGGQERGRRAGTENVLSVAAFGEMAKKYEEIDTRAATMKELRIYLESLLLEQISDIEILGAKGKRLPNTVNALVSGIDGETLLMNLDLEGVSVSTGAACSSGSREPSPVLLAMGFSVAEAQRSLRMSLGWDTSKQELDDFVTILKSVVTRVRKLL